MPRLKAALVLFLWLDAALTGIPAEASSALAAPDTEGVNLAAAVCPVTDLMPEFWQAVDAGSGHAVPAQALATFTQAHPDVYNPDFVSLPAGAEWERMVDAERAYVSAHRQVVAEAGAFLEQEVPRLMGAFRRTFRDFRCDFPFYIAPSFGRMDGAAVFVAGQHRIIFAPDVIARYHALADLRVLIDHETFHIYHHQATESFGAFATLVPTVLEALWSEGLASYVSWRMNPDVSLDMALLLPGIPEGARPHLAAIVRALLAHLDEHDRDTFEHYFVGGRQPAGYPPRAGYYVGVLVAQALAARYPLEDLAHLNGAELRDAVVRELERLKGAAAQSP